MRSPLSFTSRVCRVYPSFVNGAAFGILVPPSARPTKSAVFRCTGCFIITLFQEGNADSLLENRVAIGGDPFIVRRVHARVICMGAGEGWGSWWLSTILLALGVLSGVAGIVFGLLGGLDNADQPASQSMSAAGTALALGGLVLVGAG